MLALRTVLRPQNLRRFPKLNSRLFCSKTRQTSKFVDMMMLLNIPIALATIPATICCIKDPSMCEVLFSPILDAELRVITTSGCISVSSFIIDHDDSKFGLAVVFSLMILALYSFLVYILMIFISAINSLFGY